jgi:ribose 5-phosphate isomerase A
MQYVMSLGGKPSIRNSVNSDGYVYTPHGNILIDVVYDQIKDIKHLHQQLINLVGVVETSLFLNQVTMAIFATDADHTLKIHRR